ncbi:BRO family protein [Paenibacillus phocaensis]|uniref:BRO family protein n=1 Tax=Paenibacillus phocaensis TaxID=1776378 RepID=UPI000839C2FA|nr:BRO family protein [Paenibacillus phocaensis]
MQLSIVKSEQFGNVQCDFWRDENGEIVMTREQIGAALEYAEPNKAIAKLHERYKERLNRFSSVVKLTNVEGGRRVERDVVVYYPKGIYEICRWSRQPKANEFYDMVYDILESLRRGETALVQPTTEEAKLKIQQARAEAMLINARTRQAKLILEMQKNKTLSPVAVELLNVNALEHLTDKSTEYRPDIGGKHYTATEIGKELGISANKIGKIANAHGLKTDEYGIMALDKSPYSDKQVQSFRYNEKGRQKLIELIQKA